VNFTSNLFVVGNPHAAHSAFIDHLSPAIRGAGWKQLDLSLAVQNGGFDVPVQQSIIESVEAITLHFPLYWYSAPALVKQWLDEVLTPGWAFPREQSQLNGKQLVISVTTGAPLSSYSPDGSNGITLDEVLVPFERTAHYCGMQWGGVVASQWPLNALEPSELQAAVLEHVRRLNDRLNAPA
jgi:glutathione-regulated potassium-efflux system ancillary protein KefG